MNKSLVCLATFILALHYNTYAQAVIKAGTVQLGGSVGYAHQSTDGPYTLYTGSGYIAATQYAKTNYFSASPSVGYFVADNLAIGLNGSYNRATTSYSYSSSYAVGNEQANSQYAIGGFAQYYQMFTEQFGLAGALSASYFHSNSDVTSLVSNSSSSKGFSAGLTPSIVFFPIPKFALGASVGNLVYAHAKSTTPAAATGVYPGPAAEATSTSSSFGANFGLSQLAFSGTYFFGR